MASKDWVSAEKQDKNSDQIEKTQKVPILRFSEFIEEYEQKYLNELVERVKRKNTNLETILPLTISAQDGLINQEDFFNKKVASKNLRSYYLLFEGEFAYNKSYSNGNPWGVVKRLEKYSKGAVSTLYICFKPVTVESNFLKYYFESTKWFKEVSMIAIEGARNHGLLNIGITDFFQTKHYIPHSHREQEKIANFLSLVDKKIELMEKTLVLYERFTKEFIKNIYINLNTSNKVKLRDIVDSYVSNLSISNLDDNEGEYPLYGAEGVVKYINFYEMKNQYISIIKDGAGVGRLNLCSQNSSALGTLQCLILKKEFDLHFIYYYLNNLNFKKYIVGSTIPHIYFKDYSKEKLNIPSLYIQRKYGKQCLTLEMKKKIIENAIISLKQYKKYLLQNLFI